MLVLDHHQSEEHLDLAVHAGEIEAFGIGLQYGKKLSILPPRTD